MPDPTPAVVGQEAGIHRGESITAISMIFLLFLPRCDRGYGGAHCVPVAPLPSVLREDFNENLQQETWPEVYGAERGTLSGEPLKSGTALIFKGVRLLHATYLHYIETTKHSLISVCVNLSGWYANDCVKGSGLQQHSLHPVLLQIHH